MSGCLGGVKPDFRALCPVSRGLGAERPINRSLGEEKEMVKFTGRERGIPKGLSIHHFFCEKMKNVNHPCLTYFANSY